MQLHHPERKVVAGANRQCLDRPGLRRLLRRCKWRWPMLRSPTADVLLPAAGRQSPEPGRHAGAGRAWPTCCFANTARPLRSAAGRFAAGYRSRAARALESRQRRRRNGRPGASERCRRSLAKLALRRRRDRARRKTWRGFAVSRPMTIRATSIAVMVQGASGTAARSRARSLHASSNALSRMDEGKVRYRTSPGLHPAHQGQSASQLIKAVSYTGGYLGSEDDERTAPIRSAKATECAIGESRRCFARRRTGSRRARQSTIMRSQPKRALRAVPVATPAPQRPRNFFERLFNSRPRPAAPHADSARDAHGWLTEFNP